MDTQGNRRSWRRRYWVGVALLVVAGAATLPAEPVTER